MYPGMLPPGLVWGGLAVPPRGLSNPHTSEQVQFLNMMELCVAGLSHVPAVLICSTGEYSAGAMEMAFAMKSTSLLEF
jgi:hypothetical protein